MVVWLVAVVSILNFVIFFVGMYWQYSSINIVFKFQLCWCRDKFHRPVKSFSVPSEGEFIDKDSSIDSIEYKDINFVSIPPSSTAKGRPKTKWSKGEKELEKTTRSYTFCKRSGHHSTTCLYKKHHYLSIMSKKRKKEIQSQENLNLIFYLKFYIQLLGIEWFLFFSIIIYYYCYVFPSFCFYNIRCYYCLEKQKFALSLWNISCEHLMWEPRVC